MRLETPLERRCSIAKDFLFANVLNWPNKYFQAKSASPYVPDIVELVSQNCIVESFVRSNLIFGRLCNVSYIKQDNLCEMIFHYA